MICAKNCETLSKFVKVTAQILSVPYFLGHGVHREFSYESIVERILTSSPAVAHRLRDPQ